MISTKYFSGKFAEMINDFYNLEITNDFYAEMINDFCDLEMINDFCKAGISMISACRNKHDF